jgi:hypothetical protein
VPRNFTKEEGSGRKAIETQIPFSSHMFKTEMCGRIKMHQEGTNILL